MSGSEVASASGPLSGTPWSEWVAGGDATKFGVWIDSITLSGGSIIRPTRHGVTVIVGPNNSGKTTLLNELNYGYPNYDALLVRNAVVKYEGERADLLAWLIQHTQFRQKAPKTMEPSFLRLDRSIGIAGLQDWTSERPSSSAQFWSRQFSAGDWSSNFSSYRVGGLEDIPETPLQHLEENPALLKRLNIICHDVFNEVLTLEDEVGVLTLRVGTPRLPRPPYGADRRAYRAALAELPPLDQQGHGMRAWLSIVLTLLTGSFPVVIADEPEAYLHPPQAKALGRYLADLSSEVGGQVIVATHDRHLLSGFLDTRLDLSIVRLTRFGDRTQADQLSVAGVKKLWSTPALRYTNVLDGLFHRVVVAAEGDRDCIYYQAALDHWNHVKESRSKAATIGEDQESPPDRSQLRPSDVMFLPSNGKAAFKDLVKTFNELSVPVVVVPDFDIFNPDGTLKGLVEALGQDWSHYQTDLKIVINQVAQSDSPSIQAVMGLASQRFDSLLAEGPHRRFTAEDRKSILSVLPAAASASSKFKRSGIRATTGKPLVAMNRLLACLAGIGILPVRVGELERFAPECDQSKRGWLPEALDSRAYENSETQEHISRIITASEILLASAAHKYQRS